MGVIRAAGNTGSVFTTTAKPPPALSARLRRIYKRLAVDLDPQCGIMLDAVCEAVPAYGAITDPRLISDIRTSIVINLEVWYRALLHRQTPSMQDLAPIAAYARRRFHQGIPLPALLHAFRVGINAHWNNVTLDCARRDPSIQAEVLLSMTPYVLQHTDLLGQTLSHAYFEENQCNRRSRDQRQQELCSLIFDRPADRDRFHQLAAVLRFDPAGRRTALAFDTDRPIPGDLQADSRLDELLPYIVDRLDVGAHSPHAIRDGRLVLWTAVPGAELALQNERHLATACERLLDGAGDAIAAVGIGLCGVEAPGWRASAEQAMRALELGIARGRGARRVFQYSEMLIEDVAMTPGHNHEYFEGLLRLLHDETELIETLQAWLSTPGLARKVAAGTLDIHPNTLDYRLRKIADKLGADLDDISWLARLHIALRLRERGLNRGH